MKSTIRSVLLGTTSVILLGLSGCGENNEARIEGGGVTPPNAATTSEEALKAPKPEMKKSPYTMGPKKPSAPKDNRASEVASIKRSGEAAAFACRSFRWSGAFT